MLNLGIRRVSELRGKNPERLYERFMKLRGATFTAASSTRFGVRDRIPFRAATGVFHRSIN
jgi:hypothetical protein